jgi:UDP-glucose 4-epimerase
MARKVMIVGGSGFVASYVVRALLERGDQVVVLDIRRPSHQLQFVLGEYKDEFVFERGSCVHLSEVISAVKRHQVDDIIHLAAIQDVAYANQHPVPVYELHLTGTINVLETARLLGLRRIVIASSTGVYTARKYDPMDEDHPIYTCVTGHPAGHYGASKAAEDIIALTYYSVNQVDYIGVRFSNIYGFGMWATSYLRPVVENLMKGLPTHFATGADAQRDYTYVKDVARGALLALDADSSRLKQRIFLIGHGKLQTGADVAEVIRELEPGADVQVGPGMTEQEEHFFRTTLDISAARDQLDYQPQYDLRRGIADYIAMQRQFEASKATGGSAH